MREDAPDKRILWMRIRFYGETMKRGRDLHDADFPNDPISSSIIIYCLICVVSDADERFTPPGRSTIERTK